MLSAVNRRDLAWAYLAQGLNIGAGLILLPVILHYLSPADVGLWFVFVALGSLAQLLEFGFQPTLARNTAYVYSGAQTLIKKGLSEPTRDNAVLNLQLLGDLVRTARGIYRIVAIAASIALIGGGTLYISTLLTPDQMPMLYLPAWIAFASGFVATFYFGYFNGLLQGRGDITAANKVMVITRVSLIALGAILVVLGYGLPGLGVASLVSAAFGRLAASRYYFNPARPEARQAHNHQGQMLVLFGTLWHNSWRLGLVNLGAFLIQRGSILIAASFLGLAASASYGMTITILMALSSIAQVIGAVQLPHMNVMQAKGNIVVLREIYGEILVLSWLLFLVGSLVLSTFGNMMLNLIASRTQLLPLEQLLLFGGVIALEMNHSLAASYITTKNEVPFVKAAIYSGVAIIILSLVTVSQWGVWGLIVAQGGVQLAYNNWKWPREAFKDLDVGLGELMLSGGRRVAQRMR
jgi:O-antigen/teichoic acid export membrane protein